jgi:SH3-like domain-containing protein
MSSIEELRRKMIEDARKRAEDIIREAETKAQEIIEKGEKEWLEKTRVEKERIMADAERKAAITIYEDVLVFNKPTIYSTPKVILKKGRLCKIKKCKGEWCNITVDKFKGWVKKDSLWGLM